ncbi:LysR family transcriptional regulator [Pseudomonas gingeri]|uniref:LysR family transcriptional regulator n=1 Tax=Pseudomonas gingeri TaxID=117681 RepID=UPI00159F73E0|nr:LysR family transcriptional regulator [Pseudomonas gingeri]NVZ99034.1 LysR family transcriptional regulator [Pseudomonas gingeri]NWA13079.1 LysR family transcriptional regulator [Pseudomonas gingeri]NWA55340.1 LysR family transcriptional regulator [Pseudomonas gingeri]NWA95806.1 LysR family transcriptional regulator [Pseudomonas gingeri]NWB00894.1 LysR family transcriptional regulator [Pseudomonas gingeri]
MSLNESAQRMGSTKYHGPVGPREPWLALAERIEAETARFFLASARCGCFMQAARSLNIKSTQLRKQLALLEEQLGHPLFVYQGSALILSRDGQQLQARLIALAHERRLPVIEQPRVRLAIAESILHDILGRDLIGLLRRNASVRLEIIPVDSALSLQALSADVVVWLSGVDSPWPGPSFDISEPQALAQLDYLPHIAKRYSRVAVRPDSLDDLKDYMLVQWQHDRHIEGFQPWNSLVEQRLAGVVQVHSYELMLEMIRCSACIGLLPRYITRFDRGLAALPGLFDESMQRRAWLATQRDAGGREEVQMIVELILHTFRARREWFE